MFVCAVCGADDSREELADEVYNVDGRHYLVEGVPCTVYDAGSSLSAGIQPKGSS